LDSDRDRRDQSDWREVLDDVVAGIGRHARARRCHQDGVAVGRSFRRRADADYGTCAGPVLDNDLLAERRRELGGDDPADGIDAATGRERDDQGDRTGGIVLGHRGRAIGERNERDTEQSGSVIQSKHGKLPSRVSCTFNPGHQNRKPRPAKWRSGSVKAPAAHVSSGFQPRSLQ
jgi:hypothetical protein